MKRNRLLALIIVMLMIVASCVALAGCTPIDDSNTLVIATASDYGGYGWMTTTAGSNLGLYVSDTLFTRGKTPLDYRMAESFEKSENGLEWTFTIKNNIKWHDGEAVTADDFVFAENFYSSLPASTQTKLGWTKAYASVAKVSDYSFKYTLNEPNANFATIAGTLLPEHIWRDVKPGDFEKTKDIKYSINCGPFKVEKIQQGQYYRLVKFADYYMGEPKLNGIVVRVVNADSFSVALQSGEIHAAPVTATQLPLFEGKDEFVVYKELSNNAKILLMDNYLEKYDLKTRQAIAYLIDYNSITDNLLRGNAIKAKTILPANDPLNETTGITEYSYNIEKANTLLAEAGWVKNASGKLEKNGSKLSIKCQYMDSGTDGDIIQIINSSFTAAGIEFEPVLARIGGIDWADYNLGVMDGRHYDMKLWGASIADLASTAMYYGNMNFTEYNFFGMVNSPDNQIMQEKYDALNILAGTEKTDMEKQIIIKATADCNLVPICFDARLFVTVKNLNLTEAVLAGNALCYYPHLLQFNS